MPRTLPALLLAALTAITAADAGAQRRRTPAKSPPPPAACMDFYLDTHKQWLAEHPSTYAMAPLSALGELQQRVLEQQYAFLNWSMAHAVTDAQRALGRLWLSGFDVKAIENDGLAPIEPLLKRIEAIRRPRDVAPMLTMLHFFGLGAGFSFHAGPDPDGSGLLFGTFSEAALGLPDPDYYLREDEDTRLLLAHYTMYVQEILRLSGTAEDDLRAQMEQVINLETRLARLARPLPDSAANTADETTPAADGADAAEANEAATVETSPVRSTAADLAKQYRNLQLAEFFARHKTAQEAVVIIPNPALLAGLNRLSASLKPEQWKIYLRFHLLHTLAPYLPRGYSDAHFDFYGRILRGDSDPPVPPRIILNAVNHALGPVLAREYSARYVSAETRSAATQIAANVRAALERSLEASTWLSQSAKTDALGKLTSLKIEIAIPKGFDEDEADLPDFSFGTFAHLMAESSRWKVARDLERIGHADDSAERWGVLPQQPVLAYDPVYHRLIVSAAVLHRPILDTRAALAAQYGSYGALVGRELSRVIMPDGTPTSAWNQDDTRAWESKREQLSAQYSAWPWPNTRDIKVNGERSADANLADLAGVELAYAALEAAEPELDASGKDAFFRAWAGLWREQMGPETARYNALTQPYAPGHWRGNGPLTQLPAFSQTYQCPQGTPMTRPAQDQVTLWR